MVINHSLSPFKPWLVIIPLIFNMLFYMLKEYVVERMRIKSDAHINN